MSVGSRLAIATSGLRGGSSTGTAFYTGEGINILSEPDDQVSAIDNSSISMHQSNEEGYVSTAQDDDAITNFEDSDFISLN